MSGGSRRLATASALVAVVLGSLAAVATADSPPPGATARCNDDAYSYSQHHSGTCSHHGGVAVWLDGSQNTTTTTPPPATVTTTTIIPAVASLVIRASWTLTPGAFNPAVTQATISWTICVAGWTRRVRPPSSLTSALKVNQMARYHETGNPSSYEEDHLIPLELGGAPRNPKNLWPEPRPRAGTVDQIENSLKRQVCAGMITLPTARKQIAALKHTQG